MTIQWTETTAIGVASTAGSGNDPHPVFVNNYTGEGHTGEGVWKAVDVTQPPYNVPADAKWVFLSGMLVITHGTSASTADVKVSFRSFGNADVTPDEYMGQCIEAHIGGGQRSTMSTFVPLTGGKFEFAYQFGPNFNPEPGIWPAHNAYAINFRVQAYGR